MGFDVVTLVVFLWFLLGVLNCAFFQHCFTINNDPSGNKRMTEDPWKFCALFLGPIMTIFIGVVCLIVSQEEPSGFRRMMGLRFRKLFF